MLTNLEKDFLAKCIGESQRIDGRTMSEFRDASFEFEKDRRGQVLVTCGHSKVLAVVTATLSRPFADRPAEGNVNYFLTMGGLAAQPDDPLNVVEPEEEEDSLQRLIDRMFKMSRIVDTESLCVVPGQQVWSVRVDVHVLDHDGAVVDVCSMAVVAALMDFRRPDTTVTAEGAVRVHSYFEKHPLPLALQNPPVAASFALLVPEVLAATEGSAAVRPEGRPVLLADPTALEERMPGGTLVMAVSGKGELYLTVKTRGEAVDVDTIQNECYHMARSRAKSVLDKINVSIVAIRGQTKK